jgi:hypothetical protein
MPHSAADRTARLTVQREDSRLVVIDDFLSRESLSPGKKGIRSREVNVRLDSERKMKLSKTGGAGKVRRDEVAHREEPPDARLRASAAMRPFTYSTACARLFTPSTTKAHIAIVPGVAERCKTMYP